MKANKIHTFVLLLFAILASNTLFATKYRYYNPVFTTDGGTTECLQAGGTTPVSVTLTQLGQCGTGSGAESNVTVSWYSNTINSTVGGTLVSGPTASTTATVTFTYNAPISSLGTLYYYCVINYTTPSNVNACIASGLDASGNITSTTTAQITVVAAPTTANAGSDINLASCVTSTSLAGNTPTSGTGTWTCISNCGGVTITTPTSPTSTVTGLTASSTTVLRWTISNATCSSEDDVSINTAACASYDLCSGAIPVSCGNSYSGTTVGATNTGETTLPGCGTSPAAPGVWYVFTGDGSTVTANLCSGTSYDTKLNAYSGTACGTIASCVASNDDGCSTQSTITFGTTAGTNYYILVNGYSGATGTFSLAVNCCTPGVTSCATLNTPANGATGVASCSSLAWTAPVTAGCSSVDSYDVYFGTTNPPSFLANTTSTTYPITVSSSTTYYWQIRPKNSSGTPAGCAIFSFTSGSGGNPQYTMVDDATSPSPYSCVILTTTTNNQRGCAWDINSTLNFGSNFSYDFTVNLGSSDAGADGLAFTMQNDPLGRCKCGTAGGSMGSGGISNSVTIEIDTYLNYEDRDDFNSSFIGCSGAEDPDHLDIWFNGNINPDLDGNCNATAGGERPATPTAVRLQTGGTNYNIENGSNHILRISWNSGSGTLTATVLNTALTVTYGTISSTFNPLTVFGTNTPYFGFTASTGGLNNTQSFCNPAVLLPVELMSFNSYCFENTRKIYWSTASEHNNSFFTLEKSTDGINFEVLKVVPPSGLKTATSNYEVEDEEKTTKNVYYRLSQTDLNGVSKTFDVIESQCTINEKSLTIENLYEQKDELNIDYYSLNEDEHSIEIFDYTGRIIYQKTIFPSKGMNDIKIPLSKFSSAVYIVNISNVNEKVCKKFFKN